MERLDKKRKAIIREAAKEFRKKACKQLDLYKEMPWKFMPEHDYFVANCCKNDAERAYFDWIFIFGSEKAAREAAIMLQGVRDGKRAQEMEANIPQA